jgi:hypothetical protein
MPFLCKNAPTLVNAVMPSVPAIKITHCDTSKKESSVLCDEQPEGKLVANDSEGSLIDIDSTIKMKLIIMFFMMLL